MNVETEERTTKSDAQSLSPDPALGTHGNSRPSLIWEWLRRFRNSLQRPQKSKLKWSIPALLVLGAIAFSLWHATTAHSDAPVSVSVQPVPVVPVARVTREDLYTEVSVPAEFRPYVEVELHAKVSGYVQQINVDIGDRVKAGQVLAKLEVPEAKYELDRAAAALKRAEADFQDAHLVYTRLLAVNRQHANLVAQQELDTAEAKDHTAAAAIAAAKAEVEKDQTLLDYTRITAPFDGVITHRYADPGALIQSGTASQTQSLPLVRVSDNYRLRLDFPVPLNYVKDIKTGDGVEVRVESLGGKTFEGKISRCTYKVNDETRTMNTEIEVPNPNLELVPGMYAKVVMKVEKRPKALAVPIEAVNSDKKPTVYVISRHQTMEERAVTLGLETPTRYEVKSGLKEGDMVLIGSRSEIKPGEQVEAKLISSLAQQ